MPIPVRPAAHFHMGGIAVDQEGRSTIEGLWACGEAASSGLHGANRLASNSLLEAVVMASVVAESVAAAPAGPMPSVRPVVLPPKPDAAPIRALLDETLGVVRDRAGLERAIGRLEQLAFTDESAADPALVALLIARAALQRQESRGGHWRSDFPQRSPAWTCRLVQRLDPTGQIVSHRSFFDDRPVAAHAHA
jgi:L-aspartate oxidase